MPDDDAPPAPGFELTEHTADLGVHAWGPRPEDVFAQAARGMLSLVCDPATVTGRERYVVEVEAADESLLLAVWLNELLYLVEGRRLVFSGEFEIELRGQVAGGGRRSGVGPGRPSSAGGEPFDPARHALRAAVKAATLHRLSLCEVAGGWEGRVLLDV
ncbi:MAG TPA: archease [Thermoleophilia bacterium]|nr:archease [Thermoleophilia bacterium]